VPVNCTGRDVEAKLLMTMMIAKNKGQFDEWATYLEKCPSSIGKDSYDLIRFKPSFNYHTEKEKFLEELDQRISNEDTREIFKSVLKLKYENRFNYSSLSNFNFVLEQIEKNTKESEKFFSYQKILQDEATKESTLIGGLTRILMALDNGNKAWAKKEIESMANAGLFEIIIDLSPLDYSNDREKFKENLIFTLNKAIERFPKEFFIKALLVHLNEYFKLDEIESLKSKVDAKWSLANARDLIKSKTMGVSYPGLWFMFLTNRTSVLEVNNFLDEAFTEDRVTQFSFSDFWPFLYYTPKSESVRGQIWNKISEVQSGNITSKSRYERFLQIELLGHGYNRTKATQLENELKRTPFQLRREYFRENLRYGVAPLWSIYELLKLGDVDKEMALWFFDI
jgi:hypothetical protein